MRTCRESTRRKRPGRGSTLIVAAILFLLATPAPLWAGDEPSRTFLLTEFNAICADLGEARHQLALGSLCDEDFVDTILDLFVRADSLATILDEGPLPPRRDMGSFALSKGVVYLIESLRENYVGIVGQSGICFVEADQALKAAVAWRSGVSDPVALK